MDADFPPARGFKTVYLYIQRTSHHVVIFLLKAWLKKRKEPGDVIPDLDLLFC